jgi:hypothetical protein
MCATGLSSEVLDVMFAQIVEHKWSKWIRYQSKNMCTTGRFFWIIRKNNQPQRDKHLIRQRGVCTNFAAKPLKKTEKYSTALEKGDGNRSAMMAYWSPNFTGSIGRLLKFVLSLFFER